MIPDRVVDAQTFLAGIQALVGAGQAVDLVRL